MALTLQAPINLSGSIQIGGISQIIAQPGYNRTKFLICNVDAVNDLWWSPWGVAAPNAAGSLRVPANGGIISFNGDALGTAYSLYGAATGQLYTAWVDA